MLFRQVCCVIAVLLFCQSLRSEEKRNEWRAAPDVLTTRIERLARNGEVEAAAAVLEELLRRKYIEDTGLNDRARMSMAKGYLLANKPVDALAQVRQIPWADKSARLASEIVGLELAIRWRRILDKNGLLASGAIPPVNSQESDYGEAGGIWQERWDSYTKMAELLDRGVGMVKAEGGKVELPATSPMLALSRYSYGDMTAKELGAALGRQETWTPALALQVSILHLSEYEIEKAADAAQILFAKHRDSNEAKRAFRELRLWQKQRELASSRLNLWAYPVIGKQLNELAAIYSQTDQALQKQLNRSKELNEIEMENTVSSVTEEAETTAPVVYDEVVSHNDMEGIARYQLTLSYRGIEIRSQRTQVPAGFPASLSISSIHSGKHLVNVYKLPDRESWDMLSKAPRRELLPDKPMQRHQLDFSSWPPDNSSTSQSLMLYDLDEGFYAVTATARGCPVVVLSGFVVVSPDLHLIAGRDSILAWVVKRTDGRSVEGEPVTVDFELVRNMEEAGGEVYANQTPAWQSGFRQGFTGTTEEAFRTQSQEANFKLGLEAGKSASANDPPLKITSHAVSGKDGTIRIPLPERVRGRSYMAKAFIDRPEVMVKCSASFGKDADWTSKSIVWADKPFARPGETVRFKAVLRDFNGDSFRRPIGHIDTKLFLNSNTLKKEQLQISSHGTVDGRVTIPPGGNAGRLWLKLGDGKKHFLARIEPLRLPKLRSEITLSHSSAEIRAGESMTINLRITDAAGEPLSKILALCSLYASSGTRRIPVEKPKPAHTDMAGEARFVVNTALEMEGVYRATITFIHEKQHYKVRSSWHTRSFPFPLEVEANERTAQIGERLLVNCRLPKKAKVFLQFCHKASTRGAAVTVNGNGKEWVPVKLPVTSAMIDADTIRISTPTLDGRTAERHLYVKITPRPTPGRNEVTRLVPSRTRVNPGEKLELALGLNTPGRDMLVIGGTRRLLLASSQHMKRAGRKIFLNVEESWAPNIFLQGLYYSTSEGFRETKRKEIRVLPVNRLLKVQIEPERMDYSPGDTINATVSVCDWKSKPVPDCSISVGVVNDLVYELQKDPTPDLLKYFHHYSRRWQLRRGYASSIDRPRATLWRGVLWSWHRARANGRFGSRMGGSRNLVARGGGMRRTISCQPLLKSAEDPTIFWVADLRTDRNGMAKITFRLPASAAHFRCTARANDKSDSVLVGEVRTTLTSRLPYRCSITAPEFAHTGDRLQALVQVFNYSDTGKSFIVTLPDGKQQKLKVPGKGRRRFMTELLIPEGTGKIINSDSRLGRTATFAISARTEENDAREVKHEDHTLVLCPGMTEKLSLRRVADKHGNIAMPIDVRKGAAVYLRVKSWPDATARRRSALIDWRTSSTSSLAAVAWLHADAGAKRRKQLAIKWSKLGSSSVDCMVRIMAARRGEALPGMDSVPHGIEGDWLLARGRRLGQILPPPRERGHSPRMLYEKVMASAIAMCEGWAEGITSWNVLLPQLLKKAESSHVNARLMAFAADAALLAKDRQAYAIFIAKLGQIEWNDDLTRVLAISVIPENSVARNSWIEVNGAGEAVRLASTTYTDWVGIARDDFILKAEPGSLHALELLIQQPYPLTRKEHVPTVEFWQLTADGYLPVDKNTPLWPGRPHLLLIDNPAQGAELDLELNLPACLKIAEESSTVQMLHRYRNVYELNTLQTEILENLRDDDSRDITAEQVDKEFAHLASEVQPVGKRITAYGTSPDGEAELTVLESNRLSMTIEAGEQIAVSIQPQAEADCSMTGALLTWYNPEDASVHYQLPTRRLRIHPGGEPTRILPEPDRLLARQLAECIKHIGKEEAEYLLSESKLSPATYWRKLIRVLTPRKEAALDELLSHPAIGRPGHWTTAMLRNWVDGEPLMRAGREAIREIIQSEQPALKDLMKLTMLARKQRSLAWAQLPMPQPEARCEPASLRQWYSRLVALGFLPRKSYREWIWNQSLQKAHLMDLGYKVTLLDWCNFLREQLDLQVEPTKEIDLWQTRVRQIRATDGSIDRIHEKSMRAAPFLGGDRLGTFNFADNNLVLIERRGRYELRRLNRRLEKVSSFKQVTFNDVEVEDALNSLNTAFRQRGWRELELHREVDVDDIDSLNMTCLLRSPEQVAALVAGSLNLKIVDTAEKLILAIREEERIGEEEEVNAEKVKKKVTTDNDQAEEELPW